VKRLTIGYAAAASHAGGIPDGAPGGGATFVTGTEVTGIGVDGGRVSEVVTSRGTIATERVLVATGPFTAITAALAGVSLEVAPTRRQKLVVPDLPLVPSDAPMTIHEESAAHWRPAMNGCLALYTEAGTQPADAADPVPIDHAWAFGLLDPASEHGLARVAPFWAEVWNAGAPTIHWYLQAGQYEVTPDRRPYIGAVGPDGFYVNGGYSGHGVMAGAGGSRLAVELLTGSADAATNPLRPDRDFARREHDIL
jgi:sarcosine oxidase subunit beta